MASPQIDSRATLINLIRDAIQLEKVGKIGKAQTIYESTDDDDLKELLFQFKLDEEEHLSTLLAMAKDLDADTDEERLEERIWEARMKGKDLRLCEELELLKKQEATCLDFYTRIAGALRDSGLDDVDTDDLASTFDRMAKDEREHLDRLDEGLGRMNRLI